MLKKLLLVATIAALPSIALAQQWPANPIAGGQSYCAATNNGVCTQTVPAGPAVTGDETMPADTNLPGGGQPSTVKIPIVSVGGGILVYNAPLTGASITLTKETRQLIVEPAGTIAALTIVGPAATGLFNGQRLGICGTQIVTTLTMTAGTGTTFTNAPTAMLVPVATGAGSCFEFIFRQLTATTGTWYRTQ